MANILNIESSGRKASIALTNVASVLAMRENADFQDHAVWLHSAIRDIMQEANLKMNDLHAVAVSEGPGSYTGLRMGMAAAKGLCFALNIPLLCIPTLKIMAMAARDVSAADFYCPMIDARRMEVFTAVYDNNLEELSPATALILEPGCMDAWLKKGKVTFSGNGATKAISLLQDKNAVFSIAEATALTMSRLSYDHYQHKNWADLVYSEPFYLKEFYTHRN